MKMAVSIPDDVFEDAERLAGRLQTLRSQLYARALAEFVSRHDEDHVTQAMDKTLDEVEAPRNGLAHEAAHRTIRPVEW